MDINRETEKTSWERRLPLSAGCNFFILCLVIGAMLLPTPVEAEGIKVRAAVEKNRVYVGEPFQYQIIIDGTDEAEKPTLPDLTDFQVNFLGGRSNSSSSVTIINGQMNRVSHRGYFYGYRLIAVKSGRLTIPPVEIKAGGKTYRTNAIPIKAEEPRESEDFKLRLEPERESVYVGEAVPLHVTWYVGKEVRDFSFSLPFLEDNRFQVEPLEVNVPKGREDDYLKIDLGRDRVIARKNRENLDGRSFLTVSFDLVMIPGQAGRITIPQATVSAKVLTGYQRRSHSPFDDPFFDGFFNRGNQGVYRTVITPSNQPEITIKPLPEKGRPADFTGLAGQYSIAAQAEPLEVGVGDPITLTVMVSGPEYLKNVTLPPLQEMPEFGKNFKIPKEMAPGSEEGYKKIFTQTIRPLHTGIKYIPPVTLNYFNSATGSYDKAQSDPIPLQVKANRVVTARDALGGNDSPTSLKTGLIANQRGIAYNYLDPGEELTVADPQLRFSSLTPLWLAILILPPFCFLVSASFFFFNDRRKRNHGSITARKALARFEKDLKKLPPGGEGYNLLALAIRNYLGAKLGLPAASLTYGDVEGPLARAGVSEKNRLLLKSVLADCEAGCFGGGPSSSDCRESAGTALEMIRSMEKEI